MGGIIIGAGLLLALIFAIRREYRRAREYRSGWGRLDPAPLARTSNAIIMRERRDFEYAGFGGPQRLYLSECGTRTWQRRGDRPVVLVFKNGARFSPGKIKVIEWKDLD